MHVSYVLQAASCLSFSPTSATKMCIDKLYVCARVDTKSSLYLPEEGAQNALERSYPNMMEKPSQGDFGARATVLLRSPFILKMTPWVPEI